MTVYPTIPPRVDYDLTALGRSHAEPITALRQWTEAHINDIEHARRRARQDHRDMQAPVSEEGAQ